MCTPNTSSVSASASTFTKPSVSPLALARPLALNGKEPVLYLCPSALSCSSVLPTLARSEEHTSELQSLMRISYAVFCLKKKIFNKFHAYEHLIHIIH